MKNPWETIPLEEYETHMQLQSVKQLQALNAFMKEQFVSCPAKTVAVLGVAGGNGLEHALNAIFSKVYAIDINHAYLKQCAKRFPEPVFEFIRADLTDPAVLLPKAELLIANLLIEYIGYNRFCDVVQKISPRFISCVIQHNANDRFVSDSPYLHSFDGLESVHRTINKRELNEALAQIGYRCVAQEVRTMPNGTSLIRQDHELTEKTP